MRGAPVVLEGLSGVHAAAARDDLDDFYLFAVHFDQVADVDDALEAGVGAGLIWRSSRPESRSTPQRP